MCLFSPSRIKHAKVTSSLSKWDAEKNEYIAYFEKKKKNIPLAADAVANRSSTTISNSKYNCNVKKNMTARERTLKQ